MRTYPRDAWMLLVLLAVTLAGCAPGQAAKSRAALTDRVNANPKDASLNLRELPAAGQPYRFLVVGHLYGTTEGEDRDPAKTLLEKMPEIDKLGLRMLVSLGDMVKHSEKADFDILEKALLEPVPFPVFNTVGNHDVVDRQLYEQRYGATYYSFQDGSSRLIFLDTEREECAIDAEQKDMLAKALQAGLDSSDVQQIFIFMHKTLFFKNERLFELKQQRGGPNVWDCYGSKSFTGIMKKLIEPAAAKKPVFLFAGDVGAFANLSPYYEQRADLPITMIMTGIGEFKSDAGILVTVDGGKVSLEAYSLTGKALSPLESYTPDYWIKIVTKKGSAQ